MEFYDVITRLDGLRLGGGQDQDESWRAWLQGLDAEALKAVQDKMEAFSREELGTAWKDWTGATIDLLSQAPDPFLAISEAFRAYVQALYRASLAKEGLRKALEQLFPLPGGPK